MTYEEYKNSPKNKNLELFKIAHYLIHTIGTMHPTLEQFEEAKEAVQCTQ